MFVRPGESNVSDQSAAVTRSQSVYFRFKKRFVTGTSEERTPGSVRVSVRYFMCYILVLNLILQWNSRFL